MPVSLKESALEFGIAQRFAADQAGLRLTAEPGLVARLWNQVTAQAGPGQAELTIFYACVRTQGETFVLLEFVAGEPLEDLVKRSDPASCEREMPLFCRLLDAFGEEPVKAPSLRANFAGLELVDFGIHQAGSPDFPKLHGTAMRGAGGVLQEEFFGGDADNRWAVRRILDELAAKLIASQLPPRRAEEPAATTAPAVRGGWLSKRAGSLFSSPWVIGASTALLILLALFGVGGFLARHAIPANAGKLNLPPAPAAAIEAPAAGDGGQLQPPGAISNVHALEHPFRSTPR